LIVSSTKFVKRTRLESLILQDPFYSVSEFTTIIIPFYISPTLISRGYDA